MQHSVFLFLNIGTGELMLIFLVALMLFGGDKLPGLARSLGKGIREFKDASDDVKREINRQINNFDEVSKEEKKALPEHTETAAEPEAPAQESTINLEKENPVAAEHVNDTEVAEENDIVEETTPAEPSKPVFTKPANTIEYKG